MKTLIIFNYGVTILKRLGVFLWESSLDHKGLTMTSWTESMTLFDLFCFTVPHSRFSLGLTGKRWCRLTDFVSRRNKHFPNYWLTF